MDEQLKSAVAVGHSVDPAVWQAVFDEVAGMIAHRFGRSEPRQCARDMLLGLLSPIERKNGWWLAEQAGHAAPHRMQRLLRDAVWEHDLVRDDLRALVAGQLGGDGILIVDETGYLKKGTHSAGVQRQYTGTAGRIENTQVGVFLSYASPAGRALIDCRLYMPRSWMDDPDRCAAAGVPQDLPFATKPRLALDMILAAVDAGIEVRMVTADEVYGLDPLLRQGLREHGIGYVLAVARNQRVQVTPHLRERVDHTAALLPDQAWQRYSCGPGSKGERWFDWAWVSIHDSGEGPHSLLIRRASDGELAFYRCWTPEPVALSTLVQGAGRRWSVEEAFQQAKGQVGLDQYQCRGWTAWHRYTILAMLALAILTIIASRAPKPTDGLIALTVPEVRRLINALILARPPDTRHVLHWSLWRRRHQARARTSHHQRRHQLDLNR